MAAELAIATYNIHRAVGGDGICDLERIATVLDEVDAAIVGVQEIDCHAVDNPSGDQLARLAELTGMHGVAGPILRRQHVSTGNGLLSRLAPCVSSTPTWAFATPSAAARSSFWSRRLARPPSPSFWATSTNGAGDPRPLPACRTRTLAPRPCGPFQRGVRSSPWTASMSNPAKPWWPLRWSRPRPPGARAITFPSGPSSNSTYPPRVFYKRSREHE